MTKTARDLHSVQAGDGASSSPSTIEVLMDRIERLEAIVLGFVPQANDSGSDDANQTAYERAIDALAAGNKKPLENFLKRGGKIPLAT